MWFGVASSGATVFALPGNPVSTCVCLSRYVLPALFTAMGQDPAPAEKMALGGEVVNSTGLTFFMPIRVEVDDWGRAWAMRAPRTVPATLPPLPARTGSWSCPRGQISTEGFRHPIASLVRLCSTRFPRPRPAVASATIPCSAATACLPLPQYEVPMHRNWAHVTVHWGWYAGGVGKRWLRCRGWVAEQRRGAGAENGVEQALPAMQSG